MPALFRRAALAGAVALAAGAATGAAAHPDAELIAACRGYAAAYDAFNLHGGDEDDCPLWRQLQAAAARAEAAPPAKT